MCSKIVPSVLGIFCVVLIIHSQVTESILLDQFYDCFTYALCKSDGEAHDDVLGCMKGLNDQEKTPIFKYINKNFIDYKTTNVDKAVKEYCDKSGDDQMRAFQKTVKGLFSYENMVCGSSEKKSQCDSITKLSTCLFSLLGKQKEQKLCNVTE